MTDFDAIVAGGSVAGLLAAREIAHSGSSVLVLEEDSEIGTPEHCGGLVSMNGIQKLGVLPDARAIENDKINRARIVSPSASFEISSEHQKIIVLDRRAFDKQIAHHAQRNGAEIRVRSRMVSYAQEDDKNFTVKTNDGTLSCNFLIDATGVASIIKKKRDGVLQSAQYEVFAPWIERDSIEVAFDRVKYPGFFAWVIPTETGCGKVGVAGLGINAATVLNSYLSEKGKFSIVRKVYAPIWVGGPIADFAHDRLVTIGDAAGQSKPTTAGGIFSCGMGGILAGRAVSKAISLKKDNVIEEYQINWESIFKSEFEKMLLARRLLERLDNVALDQIVSAVPIEKLEEASETGDFDFHSMALSKILSTKVALKMAKAFLGNELRRFINI